MLTLILVALLIGLWMSYRRLRDRVDVLEARLNAEYPVALAGERHGVIAPTIAPVPAPSIAAVIVPPAPPPARLAAPPTAPMPAPLATPIAAPAPPRAVVAGPPTPVPVAAAAASASTDGWEVVVGTSWLNKLGVLVFVIGLALLVGYSMTQLGPAGRVAIGFAISAAMLGTGVVLERRAEYRNYAYGLVAGGWAGAYFTAYAMHALPAARIVTSAIVGTSFLAAIAAGMIVHSLRYRSQTVTGLA